ncbi:TIGR04282 family arsenosugar biosynthesis glycosyltransferase [Litoreibacter sp.]|nr:TIGR04282 family arsenosugar biosynthesis glycosyltransferase [Litoreibacter sp.]
MRNLLVVMVKEPRPGRVKTRLGADIGMVAAAWWFRHQVTRLLRNIRDPRWKIVLAVSPDVEGLSSRIWPAEFARVTQGRGDLGDRMARMLRLPGGRICVIGADIPGIRRHHIARGFAALGGADAVFGQSEDGGYWLVGMKRGAARSGLFDGVRWSTEHSLADSVATMNGQRVAYVDTLRDVDTADDL